MIFTESEIRRIAKFYDATSTWRKELALAGCRVEAKLVSYHDQQILDVSNEDMGWHVHLKRKNGFWMKEYKGKGAGRSGVVRRRTAEEVMEFISEKLRES